MKFELLTEILQSYCGKMDLAIEISSPCTVSFYCNDHPTSKVLFLPNLILITSLIYPMAATGNYIQSPYIMISRVFSLLQYAISFWSVKENNCAPVATP